MLSGFFNENTQFDGHSFFCSNVIGTENTTPGR